MTENDQHPLDRPVWHSLELAHAALSVGNHLARRYAPQINRFASARDDSDQAQAALAALVQPAEQVYLLQVPEILVPESLRPVHQARCVQLVARTPVAPPQPSPHEIHSLGAADAPEMLALATLTEPGPFLQQTYRMGQFIGVRVKGRLVAMAGERFRFHGYTEVSGVCTHPDYRGHGFARQLSRYVAAAIAARGETAFLHAWEHNTGAITLYEALGFKLRARVHVAVLEQA